MRPVHYISIRKKAAIVISSILYIGVLFYRWKKFQEARERRGNSEKDAGAISECQNEDLELPLFDMDPLTSATNNFSTGNIIGECGFGPVYKPWKLFGQGRYLEIVDAAKLEVTDMCEFPRSIHVGLLCAQSRPEERPSMFSVVMMLSGKSSLPQPKMPGFFTEI